MHYFNLTLIPDSKGYTWQSTKPGELYIASNGISISLPWDSWATVRSNNCVDYNKLVADLNRVKAEKITDATLMVHYDKDAHAREKDLRGNPSISPHVKFGNVKFFKTVPKYNYLGTIKEYGVF